MFIIQRSAPHQDEDEDLARALQLSVGADTSSSASASAFADPSFASTLLSSADPNDPLVQAALAQLGAQPPADASKDGDKDDDTTGKKRKGDDK